MSDGLNKVMLIGNLGADPELRYTQGGTAVLNMRMAINESYVDKDKVRREKVEWVNVTVWGARAEGLAKFLKKGSSLFVEGSLRTSSYDKDGVKVYKTEIVATNIVLSGGKREDDDTGSQRDTSERRPAAGGYGRGAAPQPTRGTAAVSRAASSPAATADDADGYDQGNDAPPDSIPF